MLIALRWPHRPSQFYFLWDTAEPLSFNGMMFVGQLRRWGLYRPNPGIGCVCVGYTEPDTVRWPYWFWHHYYWDRHVKACPVPRDHNGHVIR